jgi:hypothetical protein
MAVEKRPIAVQSSSVIQQSSSALLDFSKDSLNSSSVLEKSVTSQQSTLARQQQQHQHAVLVVAEEVVEEEEESSSNSCTETVKLEPLAFTIDFGDVTPGKKKEAPPKRFTERLAAASSSGGLGKRSSHPSSKAEIKKVILNYDIDNSFFGLLSKIIEKLSSPRRSLHMNTLTHTHTCIDIKYTVFERVS